MELDKRSVMILWIFLWITAITIAGSPPCWQRDLIDKLTNDEVSMEFKEYFYVPSHQQRYHLLYETLDGAGHLDQKALLDLKVLDHMGIIMDHSIPDLSTVLFDPRILENNLLSKFTRDIEDWDYPIELMTQNPQYIDTYIHLRKIVKGDLVSVGLLEFVSQKMDKIHTVDDVMAAKNTIDTEIELGNGDYRIYSLGETPRLLVRGYFSNQSIGEISFLINTLDQDGKKIAFGKELYLRLYNHLQRQRSIEIIRSDWTNLSTLNINLKMLNKVMLDDPGITMEEAAFLTPEGRWIKEMGYETAEFVAPPPTERRGHYKEAHILFHKNVSTINHTERYTVDLFVNNKKVTSETQYPEGFKDIYIQNLQATNPLDPTKLEAARRNISNSGFWIDTREPVYICVNPEGLAIILNGHHRIEVMRSLQQEYIPGIYMEFQTMFDKAVSGNNKYKTEIEQMFMSLAISKHIGFYNNSWMPEMPWVSNQAKQDMLEHAEDLAGQLYPELFYASDLTINLFKDYPDTVERINDLGNLTNQFYRDCRYASNDIISFFRNHPGGVGVWKFLEDSKAPEELKQNINVLNEILEHYDDVKAVGNYTKWKHEYKGTQKRRWIELESKPNTSYPVITYNVKLVSGGEVKIGEAELPEKSIMTFALRIPNYLQKQGIASAVMQDAIEKHNPKFIRGEWYKHNEYDNEESVNLTVFKQKIQEGFSPEDAAMKTPTGIIVLRNGYDGIPEVQKMTETEVNVLFKKKDLRIKAYEEVTKPQILQDLVDDIQSNTPQYINRIFGEDTSINGMEMGDSGNDYSGYHMHENLMGAPLFEIPDKIREKFKLVVKDGQLYNDFVKELGVQGIRDIQDRYDELIFVMDEKGNVFITGNGGHLELFNGRPVITAGEIEFLTDGTILLINKSGTYEPSFESLKALVHELVSRGVDIRSIKLHKSLKNGQIIENPK